MMSPSLLFWPLMSWLVAAEFQLALWNRVVTPHAWPAERAAGETQAVVVPFRRGGGVALRARSGRAGGELIPFPTFDPAS